MPEPRFEIETITPEKAKEILEKSKGKNFRKKNVNDIKKLAREIKEGRWQLNGETIKFDEDGWLKDGQHRLHACIEANAPFRTAVVYGIDSDLNVDAGKKRSIAEWLAFRGEKETTALAAALRLQWRLENDRLNSFTNAGASAPTNAEILAVLERHSQMRDAVRIASRYKAYAPHSMLTFVVYNALQIDEEKARCFIDDLCKQTNLQEGDAALVLHKVLVNNKTAKRRMTSKQMLVALMKAWNAYYSDLAITPSGLRFTERGRAAEKFPVFAKSREQDEIFGDESENAA